MQVKSKRDWRVISKSGRSRADKPVIYDRNPDCDKSRSDRDTKGNRVS